MANQKDKLEAFTQSILNDAKAECDSIFEEIERERAESISAAEDEILAETYQYIKTEVSRIRNACGRAVSKKVLENKRILFAKREKAASAVLDEVKKRIEDFTKSKEYVLRLSALLAKALKLFEDCDAVVVYLRPADMGLSDELRKASGRANLEIRENGAIKMGGLIAECPSRLIRADESFDTGFSEVQGRFPELVGLGIASQNVNISAN